MKKYIIVLFVLLIFYSCKKPIENCGIFKTGKFEQNIENHGLMIYSTRTKDGFQIDSSKLGISKYKLRWKSDCNLESRLIKTTMEVSKNNIGRKYYVDVFEVLSDNQYIYECHADGSDFIDRDTITKVD
jgi:hypothetical protein